MWGLELLNRCGSNVSPWSAASIATLASDGTAGFVSGATAMGCLLSGSTCGDLFRILGLLE